MWKKKTKNKKRVVSTSSACVSQSVGAQEIALTHANTRWFARNTREKKRKKDLRAFFLSIDLMIKITINIITSFHCIKNDPAFCSFQSVNKKHIMSSLMIIHNKNYLLLRQILSPYILSNRFYLYNESIRYLCMT